MTTDHFQFSRAYSIGHSTYPIEHFVGRLRAHGVEALADVRAYPGSRRHPQFNREALERSLKDAGIAYHHMVSLGGLRKRNEAQEHEKFHGHSAFAAYIDYTKTEEFQAALAKLETLARSRPTAFMCAEADWRHCHRQFIAEAMSGHGFAVTHIVSDAQEREQMRSPEIPGL